MTYSLPVKYIYVVVFGIVFKQYSTINYHVTFVATFSMFSCLYEKQ